MLDQIMVKSMITRFKANSATYIEQELDDLNGSVAVGGISVASLKDPLTVMCVLPTDALVNKNTESLFVNLCLDTSVNSDEKVNHQAWLGFIRLYNIFQFLPYASFVSKDGVEAGLYEGIAWNKRTNDSQIALIKND